MNSLLVKIEPCDLHLDNASVYVSPKLKKKIMQNTETSLLIALNTIWFEEAFN